MAFANQPTAINQGLAGLVPREMSASYAWGWCIANLDRIKANAGGSTFPEISKSTLRKLPMLAPSQHVARAFATIADALVARIANSAKEASALASLRDALLPRLISGELRIDPARSRIVAA
jgi:type I restriction enzyme, S subunit